MLSKQAAEFQASLGDSQAHPLLPTSCSFCAPDSAVLFFGCAPNKHPQPDSSPATAKDAGSWVLRMGERWIEKFLLRMKKKALIFLFLKFLMRPNHIPPNTLKNPLFELLSKFHFDKNSSHSYSTLKNIVFSCATKWKSNPGNPSFQAEKLKHLLSESSSKIFEDFL